MNIILTAGIYELPSHCRNLLTSFSLQELMNILLTAGIYEHPSHCRNL
jgi:hypothetical protein